MKITPKLRKTLAGSVLLAAAGGALAPFRALAETPSPAPAAAAISIAPRLVRDLSDLKIVSQPDRNQLTVRSNNGNVSAHFLRVSKKTRTLTVDVGLPNGLTGTCMLTGSDGSVGLYRSSEIVSQRGMADISAMQSLVSIMDRSISAKGAAPAPVGQSLANVLSRYGGCAGTQSAALETYQPR